ncbi:MAG TPA: outer membrane beta-barrel protein [Nitrospirales bacterium]|nr:outer membrane beta-barrel protein [Nitrospirales bacterium]
MRIFAFILALIGIGYPMAGQAEMYIAGQGGIVLNPKFTNVEGTGPSTGIPGSDLKLQNAIMYGGKVGYFFESIPWLGIELDTYYSTPHLEQQNVSRFYGVPGVVGVTQTTATTGAHQKILTGTGNLLIRYPGRVFQPYFGGGAGLSYSWLSGLAVPTATPGVFQYKNDHDMAIQFNAIAGMRFFLTRHIAAFTEYKYTRAQFQFDNVQIKADYAAHIFAAGISLHF